MKTLLRREQDWPVPIEEPEPLIISPDPDELIWNVRVMTKIGGYHVLAAYPEKEGAENWARWLLAEEGILYLVPPIISVLLRYEAIDELQIDSMRVPRLPPDLPRLPEIVYRQR